MRIERFEDIYPPGAWRIEAWQLARELIREVNERKATLPPAHRGLRPGGNGEL